MSLRIVFLCSGSGGNLRFVAEAARLGFLPNAQISGVVTDRECAAGRFAEECGFPVSRCDFAAPGQEEVKERILAGAPDIVVSNVHKILCPGVVETFRGKMLNLHYSLLPAFGGVVGARAVTQALEYGARLIGATVHWVEETLDGGLPLIQAALPVVEGEDRTELMDTVFRAGCIALLTGIQSAAQPGGGALESRSIIEIAGRPVLFSPQAGFVPVYQDEAFWNRFK